MGEACGTHGKRSLFKIISLKPEEVRSVDGRVVPTGHKLPLKPV
jgi:hypothetical protein